MPMMGGDLAGRQRTGPAWMIYLARAQIYLQGQDGMLEEGRGRPGGLVE